MDDVDAALLADLRAIIASGRTLARQYEPTPGPVGEHPAWWKGLRRLLVRVRPPQPLWHSGASFVAGTSTFLATYMWNPTVVSRVAHTSVQALLFYGQRQQRWAFVSTFVAQRRTLCGRNLKLLGNVQEE